MMLRWIAAHLLRIYLGLLLHPVTSLLLTLAIVTALIYLIP